MPDRTELAIHAVTAGLLLLGLVLFVRHLVLKRGWPRRFEPADFRRSFIAGFLQIRPLAIVFVVLALAQAAQTLVFLQAAWRGFSAEDRAFGLAQFISAPGLGTVREELLWLLESALAGGGHFLPLPQAAPLATLPLLWLARRSGSFPFSRGRKTVFLWSAAAIASWILILGSWIANLFPGSREILNAWLSRTDWLVFFLIAATLALLGYCFVLPPFYARVDQRIEAGLADKSRPVGPILTRLLFLQVAVWLLYSSQALTGYLGLPSAASGRVWALERVLRPILVPFLLTATLPAFLSPTLRGTFAKTLRWWKQDLLFFLLLALAAGSASGLSSLFLRLVFSGLSDGSFVGRAIYNVLDAEIGLAVSFSAFCCMLGRWLERREPEEEPALPA